MKYVIINFLLACLSITMGCTSSKKEIKQVVEHWMGKEIVFPSNLTMKIYGKDTFAYSLLNHKYKILHYVDTNGCHECQLKFYEWQRLQKQIDSLQTDIAIVYVVFAKHYHCLLYTSKSFLLRKYGNSVMLSENFIDSCSINSAANPALRNKPKKIE